MTTIAYSSPFVPAEWIAAHGLRPHRLRPCATVQGSLPATIRGVCPYVAATTDATLPASAALVLTTVCDQMRYAAALLKTRGDCPLFLLNVPSTWQTPAVRHFYREELKRLGRFCVDQGGATPDDAELARVMLEYDAQREPDARRPKCNGGVPLAVLGGPLLADDDRFFEILELSGGRVVVDGIEGSARTMRRPFDPSRVATDPLAELADAYFDAIPDPFRRPNTRFYDWLKRETAAHGVRGIILRRYLWCDLWHAELSRLREWSDLPVLEIDVGGDDTSSPNRMQGRIEAFLEMIE